MQAIAAAQLKAQIPVPAVGAGCSGKVARVAALEPDLVVLQRRAALRAVGLIQLGHAAVVVVFHAVHEQPHVAARVLGTEQRLGQQLLLRRIGREALGQRQLAADPCRIERVVQCVVERFFLGDAQAVHNAFQGQALSLLAGVSLQEDALQVVPAVRPVFIQPDEEQVLL